MTKQRANTTPSKVDVDPNGDVVLDVGKYKDRLLIRVSSKVLSLTSDHFATLLTDPSIKENQRDGTIDSPRIIPMEGDAPHLMLTLCKITHYKYSTVKPPTGDELIALTLLCNKYKCMDAVALWVIAHLSQHFPFNQHYIFTTDLKVLQLSLINIVSLAYLYHGHRLFRDASRSLALQGKHALTKYILYDMHRSLAGILPRGFFEALESKRRTYISAVSHELCNTIADASTDSSVCDCGREEVDNKYRTSKTNAEFCDDFEGCMSSMLQAGFYLNALHTADLLPTALEGKTTAPRTSAHNMLKKTATIAKIVWDYRQSQSCRGVPSTTALNNELLNLVNEMPKKLTGLCLNAVKNDNRGQDTGCDCLLLD